jgi:tetratricopeptide (TPR) repeat protein
MRTLTNFLIFTFIVCTSNTRAQSNENCNQNLSIFAESAKVKNFEAAYEPWMAVRNECPSLNVAIYTYGERILKSRFKKAEGEAKQTEAQDLMKLYDQWIQYFPTKKGKSRIGSILSSKAQTMIDNNLGTPAEIYATFDHAFTQDITSFTNPKGLYNYFKTMLNLHKEGSTDFTPEKLFNKYEEVSEKFEFERVKLAKKLDVLLKKEENGIPLTTKDLKRKKVYDTNSRAIGIFVSNLDAIISKESTCENLIPLYQRNFEENKGDAVWLNRAAGRMKNKECSDDPLFVTIVEALHALEPSANSAYYLGILNDKKGNNNEALKYYEESIALETDPYKKAKTLYKIALEFKSRGRKSTARKYANKALRYQPSLGKAHLMIASLYASSANDCGNTQFEKRAVYWLAAKTARRAARVDASLKKNANKAAKSYEGRAPSKTDIFTEGNEGVIIKFDCWINGSVTVPKL